VVAPFSAGIPFSAEMTPSVATGRGGGERHAQKTWQICNGLRSFVTCAMVKPISRTRSPVRYLRWRTRCLDSTKSSSAQDLKLHQHDPTHTPIPLPPGRVAH